MLVDMKLFKFSKEKSLWKIKCTLKCTFTVRLVLHIPLLCNSQKVVTSLKLVHSTYLLIFLVCLMLFECKIFTFLISNGTGPMTSMVGTLWSHWPCPSISGWAPQKWGTWLSVVFSERRSQVYVEQAQQARC